MRPGFSRLLVCCDKARRQEEHHAKERRAIRPAVSQQPDVYLEPKWLRYLLTLHLGMPQVPAHLASGGALMAGGSSPALQKPLEGNGCRVGGVWLRGIMLKWSPQNFGHSANHQFCICNIPVPPTGTVAILAQGTHRGDALCAALFLGGAKSNPYADLHRHLAH